MEIERATYDVRLHGKEGNYIHSYYLPQHCRRSLQTQDLAALYETMLDRRIAAKDVESFREEMLTGPCIIRYRAEELVKEIPVELLEPAIDACIRYYHERYDYRLTEDEANFLIALNERLRQIEHDITTECYRLNREMHVSQERGEPFSADYEIEVRVEYQLREGHPLNRDEDDNFLHI